VAILQRDQCVGDPRPQVEGERETPERLVLRHYSALSQTADLFTSPTFRDYFRVRWCGCVGGVIMTPNSPGSAMDLDIEALKAKLAALKTEHRDLDEVIARLAARAPVDQLELQRLKKRKLLLKDQITKIESELLPDIIA